MFVYPSVPWTPVSMADHSSYITHTIMNTDEVLCQVVGILNLKAYVEWLMFFLLEMLILDVLPYVLVQATCVSMRGNMC